MQTPTQNPFVEAFSAGTWNTPDDSIPFARIQLQHYLPALEEGINQARANLQEIKANSAPPSFANTILPLEQCAELMEATSSVYFNLFSAEASAELQALAKEISPKAAAFASELNLDADLFQRVKAVMEQLPTLSLTVEQKMLLEKTYRSFARNGALLNPSAKEKLRQIDQELSLLSPQFSENILKATNSFELVLQNRADLAGLPDSVIEAAALEAQNRKKPGQWVFTLQAPSYIPFLQYSARRDLRQQLWRAFNSRAYAGEFSNQTGVLKAVQLRHSRAKLLGFQNHAELTLTERMAETPERVREFLHRLLTASRPAAERDLQEVHTFALQTESDPQLKQALGSRLQPWDVPYYSEKLKEKKYSFNEEELRPYFRLENVVTGVFACAQKLYGLKFNKRTDVAKYHPDVETYEVRDESNEYIGLFYTDFFPRETKKDGAWMTAFRDQGLLLGKTRRPHVSIVCNFTKPTPTKPSLLSYNEVTTLFHEFGHALHGLLSKVNYRSLSGTSVYWDFVELPSQIMENWVREKEGLDLFAKHYETGAQIPADLVEKIRRSQLFQAGYYSLRQINFATLDLAWYSTDPATVTDVRAFEEKATEHTRLFPILDGVCTSTSFSHIFAGGYAAGYYSYKWAEVLDADAFEYFKEKGIFNREVAQRFLDNILSKGGTEHPLELYRKFRGRDPDPDALLRRDGLLTGSVN